MLPQETGNYAPGLYLQVALMWQGGSLSTSISANYTSLPKTRETRTVGLRISELVIYIVLSYEIEHSAVV